MSGIMEILIGPTQRWRQNALRLLPYGIRGQGKYLANYPMLCQIRNTINSIIVRRPLMGQTMDWITDLRQPSRSGKGLSVAMPPTEFTRARRSGNREIVIDPGV